MKKTLLTVAGAAVAVTCLSWAQPPQGGAKETITVTGESTPAKKPPKESLPAPGSAPKPKVTRDPFVQGGGGEEAAPAPVAANPTPAAAAAPPPPDMHKNQPGKKPEKVEPPVAAPQVTINGIVLSPRGNQAIVKGPSTTFLVKQGDKLGDYTVASIDQKRVLFTFKDKKFPIAKDVDPLSPEAMTVQKVDLAGAPPK